MMVRSPSSKPNGARRRTKPFGMNGDRSPAACRALRTSLDACRALCATEDGCHGLLSLNVLERFGSETLESNHRWTPESEELPCPLFFLSSKSGQIGTGRHEPSGRPLALRTEGVAIGRFAPTFDVQRSTTSHASGAKASSSRLVAVKCGFVRVALEPLGVDTFRPVQTQGF